VFIEGTVQGVCFRIYTQRQASSLRLNGWVRNRTDGSVEAVFEGEPESVRTMLEWCGHGPRHAYVADTRVVWEEPQGDFDGFVVRHTG